MGEVQFGRRTKQVLGVLGAAAAGAAMWACYKMANDRTKSGMKHKDGKQIIVQPDPRVFPNFFVNAQGLWLFQREWLVEKPRAILFLVHGLGEHIGRYEHVARACNAAGISVFGIDHQGHGQSDGTEKFVERFKHYIHDYTSFMHHVLRERNIEGSSMPKFLFGHSMGGAIALHVALDLPRTFFNGVILSAPALKADPKQAPPYLIQLSLIISEILPKLPVADLDIHTISDCHQVVERAKRDKLFSKKKLTARLAAELFREMEGLLKRSHEVAFPYLMVAGTKDSIVVPDGGYEMHERTVSKDKTLIRFDGAFHECFNDEKGEQVTSTVIEWIHERI